MAQADLAPRTAPAPFAAPGLFGIDLVAGTPVMTLQGILPVEHLLPDDRIITRAGAMRISFVSTRIERRPDLFRISARALGDDRPAEDILLPADQPIHLRDWRAKAMFGADQATVAAHRLADGTHIRRERRASVRIVHLDLPREAVIYAGGLELVAQPVTAKAKVTA